jgi:hypothetical protein
MACLLVVQKGSIILSFGREYSCGTCSCALILLRHPVSTGRAPGDDATVMLRYGLLLRRYIVIVKSMQYRRRNADCVASPFKREQLPTTFPSTTSFLPLLFFDQREKTVNSRNTPSLSPSTAMASSNVPDRGRLSNFNPQPPFFNLSAKLRNGIYGLILPGGIGYKVLVS